MPSIEIMSPESRKRKRVDVHDHGDRGGSRRVVKQSLKSAPPSGKGASAQVTVLEEQIKESQRHYNNIQSLLSLAKKEVKLSESEAPATLALCRVFCRLLAEGRLSKANAAHPNELKILEWLKERCVDYQRVLFRMLEESKAVLQRIALHSGMQLVREEVLNAGASADSVWRTALFPKVLGAVLRSSSAGDVCDEYLAKYANAYDDIRHYTFVVIA